MQLSVSELPFLSTTCAVKVHVPAWVGVPLIVPVELFSVNPGGSVPCVIENLNPPAPLLTVIVAE